MVVWKIFRMAFPLPYIFTTLMRDSLSVFVFHMANWRNWCYVLSAHQVYHISQIWIYGFVKLLPIYFISWICKWHERERAKRDRHGMRKMQVKRRRWNGEIVVNSTVATSISKIAIVFSSFTINQKFVCVNVCKHLRYTNIELHWQFIYRSLTSTTYIFISIRPFVPQCRARSNDCVELGKCQQFWNAYTAQRTHTETDTIHMAIWCMTNLYAIYAYINGRRQTNFIYDSMM